MTIAVKVLETMSGNGRLAVSVLTERQMRGMDMRRIILLFVSLLALAATPSMAADKVERWTVTQRSGDARVVRPGMQPASVSQRQQLSPGDMIVTGPSGRATLARGADYVVVAPRSQLRLPAAARANGFTAIIQDLGTLLYKVRHTGKPHFEVDTPMLAAVVKGTTFTVVVGKDRSAVQVIEGAVDVIATDGGARTLVEGGRAVFVDRGNPRALITADAITLDKDVASSDDTIKIRSSTSDATLDVSTLAAGQVRIESLVAAAKPVETTIALTRAVAVVVAASSTDRLTTPPLSTPSLTTPAVTTPVVATPAVSTPSVTAPSLSLPTATLPTATIPSVSVPPVTAPTVAVPTVTVPTVAAPTVTVPTVTAPTVTVPTVTVPTVTAPTVTVPTVTVPTVIPSIRL